MSEPTILRRGAVPAAKRKTVTIAVPEWEGSVILQELSYGQLVEIDENPVHQLALMIVDDDRQRLFVTDDEVASIKELSNESVKMLLAAAGKLNGMSAEAIEAALKN